jgi:glycosyl hydrolase family 43
VQEETPDESEGSTALTTAADSVDSDPIDLEVDPGPIDPESVDPESVDPESVDPESVDPAPAESRRRRAPWWAVGLAVVVSIAGGVGIGSALSGTAPVRAPAKSVLDPPPAPAYAEGQIFHPHTPLPDPFVLPGTGTDYLYASAGGYSAPNVPVRAFHRLGQLGRTIDAMPVLPSWTNGWLWAPDVRRIGHHYVMWFTAPDVHQVLFTGADARCLGVAVSTSPLGPFLPGPAPVLCGPSGSIDARTFLAPDGQLWLYWKADTNALWGPNQDPTLPTSMPTVLWAQRLAPDGLTLEGTAQQLLVANAAWEHKLIEAPNMVYRKGHYYLFFSANPSYQETNGIGVAVCRGPAGPCDEPYNGPLVGANTLGLGPGEESIFTQDGATWLLYSPSGTGLFRQMAVSRLAFSRDGPYVSTFSGRRPGPG